MTESQVLKRLDFPAYCVRVLDNGLVAISGGGGTSKTGVGNSIELGLVNYAAVASAKNHAQFESIHTFEPQDAVMKFTSFSIDRSDPSVSSRFRQKENTSTVSNHEFDANNSDLYIAACVHSSIEIYKVQPIIDKHSTNLTTKRTRTNSNSSSTSNPPPPPSSDTQTTRSRKNSQRKNSLTKTNSAREGIQSNNLAASASLVHCKSIHIDQIRINENENDLTVSEPENRTKSSQSGLSKSLNTANYDDESIDVLAVCQVKKKSAKSRNLLCTGTSKGSICVWELLITTQVAAKGGNEQAVRCVKVKVLREAHGKHEIDELQVNVDRSHMLSIGKDSRCVIWTLSPRVEKLTELDYIQAFRDKNLRMKHARFAQNGACLYTTYIPRSRGGGKDMSSYLQRWSCSAASGKDSGYKVMRTHRVRNTVITCVQASKDGECVVCGDYEGQIYLFDANFNKLVNFKKQHSSVVTDLAFYHDSTLAYNSNKLILSLSIDRTLQCYTYLDTASSLTKSLSLSKAPSSLDNLTQLAGKLANKLQLFSVNTLRLFLIMWVAILLFCYFFTHFEAS